MATLARDDPSPLPGMHRDHNALPSQTDGQTDTDIVAQARDVYITSRAKNHWILLLAATVHSTRLQNYTIDASLYSHVII